MMNTAEFNSKKINIPGLLEIDVSSIEDARGYFQEKFQKAKLVAAGLPESFAPVQHNIAYNKLKGTTRGFHAEPWDKYISVIRGRVFAAFVDLRQENFGKIVTLEVDSSRAVFVPRGVANAYQTLEPDTFYSYLVNAHWSAEQKYQSVNVADPRMAIAWPIPLDQAIISDKDRNNPML